MCDQVRLTSVTCTGELLGIPSHSFSLFPSPVVCVPKLKHAFSSMPSRPGCQDVRGPVSLTWHRLTHTLVLLPINYHAPHTYPCTTSNQLSCSHVYTLRQDLNDNDIVIFMTPMVRSYMLHNPWLDLNLHLAHSCSCKHLHDTHDKQHSVPAHLT
jgi:hypothetical protein